MRTMLHVRDLQAIKGLLTVIQNNNIWHGLVLFWRNNVKEAMFCSALYLYVWTMPESCKDWKGFLTFCCKIYIYMFYYIILYKWTMCLLYIANNAITRCAHFEWVVLKHQREQANICIVTAVCGMVMIPLQWATNWWWCNTMWQSQFSSEAKNNESIGCHYITL